MPADPTQLKVTKTVRIKGIALSLTALAGTQKVYFGSSDFGVHEVDLAADKAEPVAFTGDAHQSYVTGVATAGGQVISGGYDGRLIWWSPETRTSIRTVQAHDRWIRDVVASPDGRFVASVADDMLCKVWDAATGSLIHTLTEHKPQTPHHFPSMLFAVTFSADSQQLATGDKVGHIAVWESATGKKVSELEAPVMYTWDPRQRRHSIGGIRSLAFSPDGKHLAAGGIGTIGNIDHLDGPSRIEIFDLSTGERVHEISDTKFKGLVEQIVYPREGNWFVCAGGDNGGFASFYDRQTGKVLHQDKLPMHVHKIVLSEAQDALVAAGHGQIVVAEFKAVTPEPAPATEPEPAKS